MKTASSHFLNSQGRPIMQRKENRIGVNKVGESLVSPAYVICFALPLKLMLNLLLCAHNKDILGE